MSNKKSAFIFTETEVAPGTYLQTERTKFNPIKSINKGASKKQSRTDILQQGVALNQYQIDLCFEIWKSYALTVPAQKMRAALFRSSFNAYYGNSELNIFFKSSFRQTQIFKEYYMPFIKEVWNLSQTIGVVPYYYEEVTKAKSKKKNIKPQFRNKTEDTAKKTISSVTSTESIINVEAHEQLPINQESVLPTENPKPEDILADLIFGSENTSDMVEDEDSNNADIDMEVEVTAAKTDKDEEYETFLIPVIPPIEAGKIYIYLNENKKIDYFFKWTFNRIRSEMVDADGIDGGMFFIDLYKPNLNGDLNSPVSSLMDQYLDIKIREINVSIYTEQIQYPLHIIGYTPDIVKAAQSATLQAARGLMEPQNRGSYPTTGSEVTQDFTNLDYINAIQHKNRTSRNLSGIRTLHSDLGVDSYQQQMLMGQSSINSRIRNYNKLKQKDDNVVSSRFSPYENIQTIRSGNGLDADLSSLSPYERAAYMRTSNIMWLKPYETHSQATPPPAPNMDIDKAWQHFELIAAEVIGFPQTLYKSQTLKADKQFASQELNKVIKANIEILSNVLKKVFSIAILPSITTSEAKVEKFILNKNINRKSKVVQVLQELVAECEIHISFPMIPENDFDTILKLIELRAISLEKGLQLMLVTCGFNSDTDKIPPKFVKAIEYHFPIEEPKIEGDSGPQKPKEKGKPLQTKST